MEKSFPFNAVLVDGTPDRVYTAEDFAAERAAYVSNGVTSPDALTVTPADAGGMQVSVSAGAAVINGYTYWNTVPLTLALAAADEGLPRRDLILLRLDLAARSIYCAVKTGTPAEQPTLPALTEGAEIFEIPLAAVSVAAAETVVESAHITDRRPRADYILNPVEVEAAVAKYAAALEDYFGEENAEALLSASRILRTDAGAKNVLYGDGTYRPLPEGGTALVELARFTESGVFEPSDYPTVDNSYVVVLQGAGGGGAFAYSTNNPQGGNAGGYAVVRVLPHISGPYTVTVGAGGAGVIGFTQSEYSAGNDGGDTTFGPFCAKGGKGGVYGSTEAPAAITYGVYTAGVGTSGATGAGGSSMFGTGGANNVGGKLDAGNGGIGAGGGAQSDFKYYSGAGGDGIVIVYGCPK